MIYHDDVAAITRLRYEYAHGIDTLDYELLRGVFTDVIRMDFSLYDDRPPVTISADDWVFGSKKLFDGLDATSHFMSNPLVDIRPGGNLAVQRMTMQATHFLDDVEFTIGGWYEDLLVHTLNGWKIESVTLNVTWRRGDYSIMQKALERS